MHRPVVKSLAFILALWVFCAAVECGKNVRRRHDVHRIVLKTKNRNRPKRLPRPPMHAQDFHRNHFRFEDSSYDSNFDQFGDHSILHDVYSEQPNRYHNHKKNPYKDRPQRPTYNDKPYDDKPYGDKPYGDKPYGDKPYGDKPYDDNPYDFKPYDYKSYDYKPYDYHNYQGDYEGSTAYRGSYKDFERYKAMMDRYNKRLEDNFKAQSAKHKLKSHYGDASSLIESHERPPSWKPPKPHSNKGEWSPMSVAESPTKSQYNDLIDESPSAHIEDLIEITTSKPQKRPAIIVEGHPKKVHKPVNYNFNTNSFHNHKYSNKTAPMYHEALVRAKGAKNNTYEVHEEFGESIVSPMVANFQNVMPSSGTSYTGGWMKPVVGDPNDVQNDAGFGARTKSRTKRPATSV